MEDTFFISFLHTPLETLVTTVQTTGVPTRIVMIVDRRSAVSSMSVCVWKRGMWIVLPDNDPVRLQLDMVFNFRWKWYDFPIVLYYNRSIKEIPSSPNVYYIIVFEDFGFRPFLMWLNIIVFFAPKKDLETTSFSNVNFLIYLQLKD